MDQHVRQPHVSPLHKTSYSITFVKVFLGVLRSSVCVCVRATGQATRTSDMSHSFQCHNTFASVRKNYGGWRRKNEWRRGGEKSRKGLLCSFFYAESVNVSEVMREGFSVGSLNLSFNCLCCPWVITIVFIYFLKGAIHTILLHHECTFSEIPLWWISINKEKILLILIEFIFYSRHWHRISLSCINWLIFCHWGAVEQTDIHSVNSLFGPTS